MNYSRSIILDIVQGKAGAAIKSSTPHDCLSGKKFYFACHVWGTSRRIPESRGEYVCGSPHPAQDVVFDDEMVMQRRRNMQHNKARHQKAENFVSFMGRIGKRRSLGYRQLGPFE